MRKEILHELNVVGCHPHHIARASSYHISRRQPVEFFKQGDAHLGEQPKSHVVRDPGLQPVKHPGDRRHDCKQDQQIHKGLTGFNSPHRQSPDHANPDIREHPRHPKAKRHREPAFIGHDVFHEFARCRKPAEPLRLDDGVRWRELRLLAIGRHLLGFAYPLGIDFDCAARAFFGLRRHQLMIDTVPRHEFSVGALFGNTPLVQHQNPVGIDNTRKPMRKDQRGASSHQPIERVLDDRFVLGIHCRERFIQNQDRRVSQDRPGDGNALALPAGKPDAPLADYGVISLGQQRDKLVGVGRAAGRFECFGRGVGLADPKVIRDRAVKKISILIDDRDLAADIFKAQVFKIMTPDLYRARIGIIKTQQQPHDRRLARAAWPDKAHPLAGRHGETQSFVRGAPAAGIGKTHPFERNRGFERIHNQGRR